MKTASRFSLPLAIGALVTFSAAVNLSLSARQGSLAMPPIYDDVGYLLDAYWRLYFDGVNSIASLAKSFVSHPPHAPMSTLTAMLGYSLLGPHVWAPYFANIWALALYAAGVYFVARFNLSRTSSVLIVSLMLFVPAAQLTMTEFRPDLAAGIVFSIALFSLINTQYVHSSRAWLALVGLLGAAAIMAKPTAFVASIPMLSLAALIGVFRPGYYSTEEMRRSLRRAIGPLILSLVVLIPFVAIWAPSIVAYTYFVLFTTNEVWATPGDSYFHWMFYSVGDGGRIGLGYFFKCGALVIAIDLAVSISRRPYDMRSYNAMALYALPIVIYIGLALTTEQTVYQGAFFYFPFLLSAVLATSRILARWVRSDVSAWIIGAAVALAALFLPFASLHQDVRAFPEADHMLEKVSNIVANKSRECGPGKLLVFSVVSPYPLTPETVALNVALHERIRIEPRQLFMIGSADELVAQTNRANFVLVPNKWGLAIQPTLPGLQFLQRAKDALAIDPDWEGIPIPAADPPILYVRNNC